MSDSKNIAMLAHTWQDSIDPVGWYMSEKLDGMRAIWTGESLRSRNGKLIHAPEWWTATLPKDRQLDGELYLGRGNFQKVVSACRKITPVDSEWVRVAYMVFDVIDTTKPWIERFNILPQHPVIPVTHWTCHSREQMIEFYNSIVDNGGEGIMLRHPDKVYTASRSHYLLKVKPELSLVAEVIGHTAGEGKYVDMVGALKCRAGNVEFDCGSGLTDADRTLKYAPKIGSLVNIKYQCFTDAGVPRFPVFAGRA